jgi:hypothetical protein
MIITIIILSVCVLFLLIALLLISVKCIDLNATANFLQESLRDKEEVFCRAQALVLDRFDFYVPGSKLYLEIAERDFRKEQSND